MRGTPGRGGAGGTPPGTRPFSTRPSSPIPPNTSEQGWTIGGGRRWEFPRPPPTQKDARDQDKEERKKKERKKDRDRTNENWHKDDWQRYFGTQYQAFRRLPELPVRDPDSDADDAAAEAGQELLDEIGEILESVVAETLEAARALAAAAPGASRAGSALVNAVVLAGKALEWKSQSSWLESTRLAMEKSLGIQPVLDLLRAISVASREGITLETGWDLLWATRGVLDQALAASPVPAARIPAAAKKIADWIGDYDDNARIYNAILPSSGNVLGKKLPAALSALGEQLAKMLPDDLVIDPGV